MSGPKKSRYHTGRKHVDDLIHKLITASGLSEDDYLLKELLVTVLKLKEDETETADVKMMNSAMKELWYSLKVFSPFRHVRKVTVFGSARTPHSSPDYKQAKAFSREIVKNGWMVITGASSGIMSAGNEGAGRNNSFGLSIRLPFETDANPAIKGDSKLVNFKYFFTRKLMFIRESDATVLCPGGFGTHDEGFETLTLVQTGKAPPRPIVCLDPEGSEYWKGWKRFCVQQLQKGQMIDKDDLNLIHFTHDHKDAAKVITHFYSNYHSLRYIRDTLVIRVKQALTQKQMQSINRRFKDMLASGKIEQRLEPFEEEMNEPHTLEYPRVFLHFNRRHHVRIKCLVDALNDG
ncbi:MAG: LOG family protein [Candidatus Omnitrophica bacterium]|nr:LOG family protein [Candidatus Omnitrophota bacterium]